MLGVFSGKTRWVGKYVFLSVWSIVLYPIGLLQVWFFALPYVVGGGKNKREICLFSLIHLQYIGK